MGVLVSGVRSKTNLLRAPVRAPCPQLQRRCELVQARFGSERTPDSSTTNGSVSEIPRSWALIYQAGTVAPFKFNFGDLRSF